MTCRAISATYSAWVGIASRSPCRTASGAAWASRNSASLMKRRSCIRRSTYSWRVLARFGLLTGLNADGALGSPASIAASATEMSFSGLPK